MEAFVWNERFVTGENIVDREHQELVRIINLVIDQASRHTPADEIAKVLGQLVNYAQIHFRHEEELMAATACDPRFQEAHRRVHREFADQVGTMSSIPGTSTEDLLRFLTAWLAHHILGMDQAMARQIKKIRQGASATSAYEAERQKQDDPTTASMLAAMAALYRIIAARNDALQELNQGLEQQVAERTASLRQANNSLQAEQERLKAAMINLEQTQKRLFESEHKRSEEAKRNLQRFLAQIVDGDPVPTLVIDQNHQITHWNKACATISGLPAEQMVGTKNQWQAFYPEARPVMADLIVDGSLEERLDTYYHNRFRRSSSIPDAFEAEDFFPHLGNGGRWLFFTAAPIRNAQGEVIGAIETLQDVTERHQAQDELLRYQGHLEEQVKARTGEVAAANAQLEKEQLELTALLHKVEEAQQQLLQSEKMAAIGQLAAGVAHEINNPVGFVNSNLGTLKTYIDRLMTLVDAYEKQDANLIAQCRQAADIEFLREDLPSLVDESREGLSRVTKIVQDLKDFSRVDQAEVQPANLNAALESTLNVVWNELKYKADIVRELGDLPDIVCVPAQINQVFMNLLVNAAQAIPQHGTITLRSGVTQDHAWFEIEDNGCGMSEAVQKRIFEPFYTTKPVGKGTGLGLSISYDIIVKKHHGQMDVRSTPGKGTCFRISLPLLSDAMPT